MIAELFEFTFGLKSRRPFCIYKPNSNLFITDRILNELFPMVIAGGNGFF